MSALTPQRCWDREAGEGKGNGVSACPGHSWDSEEAQTSARDIIPGSYRLRTAQDPHCTVSLLEQLRVSPGVPGAALDRDNIEQMPLEASHMPSPEL